MSARVTLASLDQKLDSFMEQVQKHMDRTSEALDGNGKPGLKTRIELNEAEIKEIKESRNRSLAAVWSTLVVVVGTLIVKIFKG